MNKLATGLHDTIALLQRDGWSRMTFNGGPRSLVDAMTDCGLTPSSAQGRIARTIVIKIVSRLHRPCMTVDHLWAWEASPETTFDQVLGVLQRAATDAERMIAT